MPGGLDNNTDEGDLVEIDIASGVIKNKTKSSKFLFQQFSDLVREIILAGGVR